MLVKQYKRCDPSQVVEGAHMCLGDPSDFHGHDMPAEICLASYSHDCYSETSRHGDDRPLPQIRLELDHGGTLLMLDLKDEPVRVLVGVEVGNAPRLLTDSVLAPVAQKQGAHQRLEKGRSLACSSSGDRN